MTGAPVADWHPERTLPLLDIDTEYFWTSGADGHLRVKRCGDCGRYLHPPTPVCSTCRSRAVEPTIVSGRGTVATFTVNHQPWSPGFPPPYVYALVELEEQAGLNLATNIVGCPIEDVRIGMPVEVYFDRYEDVWLPLFRPRRDHSEAAA